MTIEEKKERLNNYCGNRDGCTGCLLRDEKHEWTRPCYGNPCLNIADSPEKDLDKALAIIGEAAEEPFEEPDFFDKKLNLPNDPVNHPSHYTDGKIEVIDFITDKKLGFCLGNAVKYISRAGKKDPTKEVEDLEKAIWYINRYIETLREG